MYNLRDLKRIFGLLFGSEFFLWLLKMNVFFELAGLDFYKTILERGIRIQNFWP